MANSKLNWEYPELSLKSFYSRGFCRFKFKAVEETTPILYIAKPLVAVFFLKLKLRFSVLIYYFVKTEPA